MIRQRRKRQRRVEPDYMLRMNNQNLNRDLLSVTNRGLQPVPPRMISTMRYADNVNLTSTAGASSDTEFRLNSLYDPLYSGSGVFPSAFTTMSNLYQNYRVRKVLWRCLFNNTAGLSSSSAGNNFCAVIPTCSGNSLSSFAPPVIMSQPRVQFRIQQGGVSEPMVDLRGSIRLHELLGMTEQQYNDSPSTAAAVTTNPSVAAFLHIILQNLQTTNSTVGLYIILDFEAEWFSPIQTIT